ncbi:ribosome recycling factor [Candidatus Poribacteria bacterium]|nr:ribosome recycling factor [Candidatus Poribacteria bacterium]
MVDQIFRHAEDKMKKVIEFTRQEFVNVRTGRASGKILDNIKVECYNSVMPINQLAMVSTPDARTITIQPWDKASIAAIEKAILKSDIGITPINDGSLIRINLPALTEERRKDLIKLIKKIAEEQKIAARNIRKDANEMLKENKKKGEISEDENKKAMDKIQHLTDKYIVEIDNLVKHKEHEIMEF